MYHLTHLDFTRSFLTTHIALYYLCVKLIDYIPQESIVSIAILDVTEV
jgi:hypothetical protein